MATGMAREEQSLNYSFHKVTVLSWIHWEVSAMTPRQNWLSPPPVGRLRAVGTWQASPLVQGRGAQKGYLVTRINITLSILKFRTWFFAQIVENQETQLSSPFLGPGDIFSKSYDENQIWSERQGYVRARAGSDAPPGIRTHAWDPTRARRAAIQLPYKSGFRHNFSKNCPQDLKIGYKVASHDSLKSARRIRS
jgi:hypothetical protein